jgi:hypothetical protein
MLVCRIKPPARCPGNLLLEANHVSTDLRLFLQVRCLRSPVTLYLEGPVVLR